MTPTRALVERGLVELVWVILAVVLIVLMIPLIWMVRDFPLHKDALDTYVFAHPGLVAYGVLCAVAGGGIAYWSARRRR